jgi:hypothetical protein
MEGETNGQRDPNTQLEEDLCIHIFTVSSAMVGVCLTVIGLIRVVVTLGTADTLADDLLAGDALLGASLPDHAPNASPGKNRRRNIHHSHDRHGDHLCIDYLQRFCSDRIRRPLEQLLYDP